MTSTKERAGQTRLTRKKLQRFLKLRNGNGFNSNMQFQSDCEDAGFRLEDLGQVQVFDVDSFKGYLWTPVIKEVSGRHSLLVEKTVRLMEYGRTLHLEGEPDPDGFFAFWDKTAKLRMGKLQDAPAEAKAMLDEAIAKS